MDRDPSDRVTIWGYSGTITYDLGDVQLKSITAWDTTLPIPVPVDQVHWQTTTIKGNQGLLLNDNSGVGSAAIWHANGHLFGVAGSLKADVLKQVAESLH